MKKNFIFFMGVSYIAAGANHFWHAAFYIKMLQGFLPHPTALVDISGVAEILCGVGLLVPATHKIAAWATIALLVAILPANINMALHPDQWDYPLWSLYLRLPLQLVLIWLAYIYTKD
jgi:uncharacterized membrane protein